MNHLFSDFDPKIIILEGLMGVGKTRLGNSIEYWLKSHQIPVLFFEEFVDETKLAAYIADMKKLAVNFQRDSAQKTMDILDSAREYVRMGFTVIVDRGMIGNRCFAEIQHESGFISEEEIEEYRNDFTYDFLQSEIKVETWYLKCEVSTALGRIRQRNRDGENAYTKEYLKLLKLKHEYLLTPDRVIDYDDHIEMTLSGYIPEKIVSNIILVH